MIQLEQNTPQWLEFRKNKIGASEAPIVMKKSPYRTPFQLWEEKLSLADPQKQNWAMQKGHENEPRARAALEEIIGMPLRPQISLSGQRSWMMASLDALSECRSIAAEIKHVGEETHEIARQGKVPDQYIHQCQHILECEGLDRMIYFSCHKEERIIVWVGRDEKIIKEMLEEEEKFYECVQNFKPPEMIDRDYVKRDDLDLIMKMGRIKELKPLLDEYEKLRKDVIKICDGRNTETPIGKVSKYLTKGRIDYGSIPELEGINLEQYRKEASECWRINTN